MTIRTTHLFIIACLVALSVSMPTDTRAHGQADHISSDFDEPKTAYDPKHTPKIIAPDTVTMGEWFEVTIEIGKESLHPSFAEHFVRSITLFHNDVEIARTYLHPVRSKPKVTYTIALKRSGTLKAVEVPNHTAEWSATKEIKVVPPKSD